MPPYRSSSSTTTTRSRTNFAGGTSSPDGEPDNDPAIFLQRRAAAYQAYYENMPLRRTSIPQGPDIQLYRRLGYGRLVDFHVLDTRRYRRVEGTAATNNQVRLEPTRTLLGAEQEAWLVDGMTRSGAAWNVLAQQSKVAETDDTEGSGENYPNDNWDGYAYSRTQLFNAVHDRGIDNMVILSGDAHVSIASDLKPQFKDPASPVVGAEFLGTSITSGGNGNDINATGQRRLRENPHLKFYNNRRGYQRVQLSPQELRVEFQVLPYVNTPGAPAITRAVAYVEAGRPGVAQIETKTIV
jgi:alkaline phosphatase D